MYTAWPKPVAAPARRTTPLVTEYTAGPAGAGDLWLVGGVPLACAGLTALLALGARS